MANENLFRSTASQNGISLKSMAEKMDIHPATLYRKLKGKQDFTEMEIRLCIELFGKEAAWEIFFS